MILDYIDPCIKSTIKSNEMKSTGERREKENKSKRSLDANHTKHKYQERRIEEAKEGFGYRDPLLLKMLHCITLFIYPGS